MANYAPSYPDILGYITNGPRCVVGTLQVAAAVRPKTVRAGRPFAVLVLVQNTADEPTEVTATLMLPELDAARKPKHFTSKTDHVTVKVGAAEVGYILLPAACAPETAPGESYKLGVAIEAKAPTSTKVRRIRDATGGGSVVPEILTDEAMKRLADLKSVPFSATKRMLRDVVDVPFAIAPPKAATAPVPDYKASWINLWALHQHQDIRLLLVRYADTLKTRVLPQFKRAGLVDPLREAVEARFKTANYELKPPEAALIAKLMALILEFATPRDTAHGYIAAGIYSVAPLLDKNWQTEKEPAPLPQWCEGMLRILARDERAATQTVQLMTKVLFDPLLRDTIAYAFEEVTTATGDDLGTPEEMRQYGDDLVRLLAAKEGLHFNRVYMPLVLGGVLINDRLLVQLEKPGDLLGQMLGVLEERQAEIAPDDRQVYDMAVTLVDRVLFKYGYRQS
jgi:hypothetical protein